MELEDATSKEDVDDLHHNNKRKPVEHEPSVQGHISGSTSLTNNIIQKPSKRKQTTNVLAAGQFINTQAATPFMNVHNSMSRSPFSDIINVIPSSNAMGNPRLEASVNKVNENIRVTPTNTNVVPNSNILTMNSTTSSLSPVLALRRRGRPPKDACANKENIHTASHFNPKTFLTPTSTCVGMSSNILTPNIPPSFSASANKENVNTPSQLNPDTLLTPTIANENSEQHSSVTKSTCKRDTPNSLILGVTHPIIALPLRKPGRHFQKEAISSNNSCVVDNTTTPTRTPQMNPTGTVSAPNNRSRFANKSPVHFNIETPTHDRRTPTPNRGSSNLTPSRESLKGKNISRLANIMITEIPTINALNAKQCYGLLKVKGEKGAYSICCSRGKIKLPVSLKPPPELIKSLLTNNHPKSTGGTSSSSSSNNAIDYKLTTDIKDMLDQHNPLVRKFRMAGEDETPEHKKSRVTMREWFAYRLMDRPNVFSTILNGRRLFQQFLVDGFTMVEAERLGYVLRKQKDLRCETRHSDSDESNHEDAVSDNEKPKQQQQIVPVANIKLPILKKEDRHSDSDESNHEDAVSDNEKPKQQQQIVPVANIKLPILKKEEYDIWALLYLEWLLAGVSIAIGSDEPAHYKLKLRLYHYQKLTKDKEHQANQERIKKEFKNQHNFRQKFGGMFLVLSWVTTVPPVLLWMYKNVVGAEGLKCLAFGSEMGPEMGDFGVRNTSGFGAEVVGALGDKKVHGGCNGTIVWRFSCEEVSVEYDWKPSHCITCKTFCHAADACPLIVKEQPKKVVEEKNDGFQVVQGRDKGKKQDVQTGGNVKQSDAEVCLESDEEDIEHVYDESIQYMASDVFVQDGNNFNVCAILKFHVDIVLACTSQAMHTQVILKVDRKALFCTFVYASYDT
ncbi:hypothetical protein CTI12_AA452390 [Artemisia annua]|uniref:Helitron helicase-like domain-containing protein n=1 Tax=Artemisia annua TaxID=35608 RepID=A0A2U1LR67_ARTAN|nr:hypothetical protein CTI12_AA452390 [Artemisia annua]